MPKIVENKALDASMPRKALGDQCLKPGQAASAVRPVSVGDRGHLFPAGTIFVGRRKFGQDGMDYAEPGATKARGGYGWTSCSRGIHFDGAGLAAHRSRGGASLGALAGLTASRLGGGGLGALMGLTAARLGAVESADPVLQVHFAWNGGDAAQRVAGSLKVQGKATAPIPYHFTPGNGWGDGDVWIRFDALFVRCSVAADVIRGIDRLLARGSWWSAGNAAMPEADREGLRQLRAGLAYQAMHNHSTPCPAVLPLARRSLYA